jgi:hypothetical protein
MYIEWDLNKTGSPTSIHYSMGEGVHVTKKSFILQSFMHPSDAEIIAIHLHDFTADKLKNENICTY